MDTNMASMTEPVSKQLRHAPPGIHGGGDEYWGLAWPALEWLEREVTPGMATLETGSGSSTIVFAARGAIHQAVTTDPQEEKRIRATCERLGISSTSVIFHIGPSHEVLPSLPQQEHDLVLIDGAHGFPYPLLDWWHVAARLRPGGRILFDDAYMPPVAMIIDALARDGHWELAGSVGYRTAIVRKRANGLPPFDWDGRRIGGRMSFRYLPPAQRVVGSVRHRVFSTKAGLALVAAARRRSNLRWRKTG